MYPFDRICKPISSEQMSWILHLLKKNLVHSKNFKDKLKATMKLTFNNLLSFSNYFLTIAKIDFNNLISLKQRTPFIVNHFTCQLHVSEIDEKIGEKVYVLTKEVDPGGLHLEYSTMTKSNVSDRKYFILEK
ncbi:hypothetical protein RF11_03405 [Thelohanellus kitauei]|uniref:Uncharacterized protein n=1 Tax=Thelohanellus kitauei TaxID=669202 RepID=A0A0C2IPA2_THEKT|nr:hypothetical protein RF11_03405 [Thelohanellus kitauei]